MERALSLTEDWGLFVNSLCSPGLLCYSHRCLIPAVVPASLSGSISAGQGGGWHPGTAPGCVVLHTPGSAQPAHQTAYPPTSTAWGRLSCPWGRGEGWWGTEGWILWPLLFHARSSAWAGHPDLWHLLSAPLMDILWRRHTKTNQQQDALQIRPVVQL